MDWALKNEISAFNKRKFTPLGREDPVRRHLRKETPPAPHLPVPSPWASHKLELWDIHFCCFWAIQLMVFCYSNSNGWIQSQTIQEARTEAETNARLTEKSLLSTRQMELNWEKPSWA
jgi:hypothetical protein